MIYTATLPPASRAMLPPALHVKRFTDHDTFAAYLNVWADARYPISCSTGTDALIGGAA